jgi:hypothetical protein
LANKKAKDLMGFLDLFKKLNQPIRYSRLSIDHKDRELVKQKWAEIQDLMVLGRPSNFRQAILEADKLLDFVLKKMNYKGPSLADRLRAARDRFSDYQGVWDAHKIRNRLVHEVGSEIFNWDAKEAIKKFEKAFKDLGVI